MSLLSDFYYHFPNIRVISSNRSGDDDGQTLYIHQDEFYGHIKVFDDGRVRKYEDNEFNTITDFTKSVENKLKPKEVESEVKEHKVFINWLKGNTE